MDTQKDMLKNTNDIQLTGHLTTDEQLAQVSARMLNDNAQHLNAVTLQRLSDARGLAVGKLAASQGVSQSGNVLQWIGSSFEHHRLMSAAIVAIAMLLTFLAAQKYNTDNNLENSDAFLLASELPPEAFADKGFDTWLVSKRD